MMTRRMGPIVWLVVGVLVVALGACASRDAATDGEAVAADRPAGSEGDYAVPDRVGAVSEGAADDVARDHDADSDDHSDHHDDAGSDDGAAASRDSWEDLRGDDASGAEWFDSVEDMADAADLVVVGRVAGTTPDGVTVDVTEVLGGELTGDDSVTMELAGPSASAEESAGTLEELVDGDLVLFLRDTGSSDELWRLINNYALVTETNERPVDVPLAEVPSPDDAGDPAELDQRLEIMTQFLQWDTLDSFITDMRDHLEG